MNKFTLNKSRFLHSFRHLYPRLDRTCVYRTRTGNSLLINRKLHLISLPWKGQKIFDRGRVLATSVRSYSSADINEEKEKGVVQESNVKKQLKSEDLFRILSLAKPEYKSLAGKYCNSCCIFHYLESLV